MQAISAALVKAQREFGPALKTSQNPHFRSKYADLSACVEAVIDGLNNNGIMLMQPCHEDPSGVTVETLFIHESGEQISAGKLHVPASKQDPQGYGSALTYARRYGLMAACGIAPEDDDGNAASKKPAPRHKPTDGALVSAERMAVCDRVVLAINERMSAGDVQGAYGEAIGITDTEERTYLWSKLDATTRSSIKTHERTLRSNQQTGKA